MVLSFLDALRMRAQEKPDTGISACAAMLWTMGKVTYSQDLSLAALQSLTVSNKVVFEPGSIQTLSPMLKATGFRSSTRSLKVFTSFLSVSKEDHWKVLQGSEGLSSKACSTSK